jgi:hypothetical protein
MKRWLHRSMLAVLIAANLVTPAMAQIVMPTPLPAPTPLPGQVVIQPGTGPVVHNMVAPAPMYPPSPVPMIPPWPVTNMNEPPVRNISGPVPPGPIEGPAWRQAVLGCLNKRGVGCDATHNTIGCGSCYGHCIFVFGSCRQFFGEPCYPLPPKDFGGEFMKSCSALFGGPSVFNNDGSGGGCASCGCGW